MDTEEGGVKRGANSLNQMTRMYIVAFQLIYSIYCKFNIFRGSIIVWRFGGFGLILDEEFGCSKKISAVYGLCFATRLQKLEFKRKVYWFSLTSLNLLLDNCCYLSGLHIELKSRSQIADSYKFSSDSYFIDEKYL